MYQYYSLISLLSHFDHVILADGDYPSHPIALHLLTSATHLVCCDRAGMQAMEHGLHPEAIVGDGDSIPENFRRAHAVLFHHEAEQDDNDLTKATRFILQHMESAANDHTPFHEIAPSPSSDVNMTNTRPVICYLGATGKREDHTLGNISLMIHYYRNFGISPVMVTNYGWWVVGEDMARFETFEHQQVSILNVSCKNQLSSTGLRWPTRPFTALWQGTLNDASGSDVTLHGDGLYLVFRTFERKE
ncbi:MAG: thiamine diphosphokinase [Prevotella sp.]|jgi:thiamine pyrophosphokinase